MAHFNEHCDDCERILGRRWEDVNNWMDAAFPRFGPRHRFDRHHWGGVAKAEEMFGPGARAAAIIHILRDCGHIPNADDYYNGTVDQLGMAQGDEAVFNGYWDKEKFQETAKAKLALDAKRGSDEKSR